MITNREKGLFFLLAFVLVLAGLYLRGVQEQRKMDEMALVQEAQFEHTFGDVALIARSAYVYDIRDKKALFAKNETDRRPLASLTKVMTALTALETLPERSVIAITAEALGEEGDSGLLLEERWYLSDLARFMLVSSSNDAAKAISLGVTHVTEPDRSEDDTFIQKMNDEAIQLGLFSTSFLNATGLDAADLSSTGGTGTAADITMIAVELLRKHPEIFTATVESAVDVRSIDGFRHTAKNTNVSGSRTQLLIASKTGFTDLAGGNLTVIFDAGLGHPIAVTVLGSTESGRFADVESLIRATMRYITTTP